MNNPTPNRIRQRPRRPALVIASIVVLISFRLFVSSAATLSWSGGGTNNNWNDSANWGSVGVPANGDTLIFTASQPRLHNTNNIVGLTLNQIRFAGAGGGYAIFGNALAITNGIEATNSAGLNVISNNITLGSPGDFFVDVATGAKLFLGGTLSGSVGLIKGGGGTNTLGGGLSNTYGGTTTVTNGLLELSKFGVMAAAIPHDLIIGNGITGSTVRNVAGAEIADIGNVTVNRLSTWDLDDHMETITALTLNGGTVTAGTGMLTLGGNITSGSSITTASISGNLSLGGVTRTFDVAQGGFSPDLRVTALVSGAGGILKIGAGEMSLTASNTYSGLTTVSNGFLRIEDSFALGSTNSGTLVMNNAVLAMLFGVHVGLEPLTISGPGRSGTFGALSSSFGSNSWDGVITLASNTTFSVIAANDFLNLAGAIVGTGDLTKIGPGTMIMSGAAANTYSGSTFFNEGTNLLSKSVTDGAIPHDLFVGDGTGGSFSDVVQIIGRPQIATVSDVTIATSGLLDLNEISEGIGTLTGFGRVDLGSTGTGALLINGSASTTYGGLIVGAGGDLVKNGTGTFTLTGNNTYSGLTTVNNGALIVNGSQAQSPVIIGGSNGTLGGSGTVGNVTNSSGGVVAPGASTAILTTSNATFSAATSDFTVELNGTTAGSGYDQLNVRGTVALGGATLKVLPNFSPFDAPADGATFTIINNDGADAVNGTFNGLAQNATLNINGFPFRISYTGGSGNDVVLTQLAGLPILSIQLVSTNSVALSWTTNVTGFTLEANTDLNTSVWSAVFPSPVVSGTNNVVTNLVAGIQKYYRLRSP